MLSLLQKKAKGYNHAIGKQNMNGKKEFGEKQNVQCPR